MLAAKIFLVNYLTNTSFYAIIKPSKESKEDSTMKTYTKYYKVTTHRAHQGIGRSIPITFYIAAENALHASKIAQNMSGVKHSRAIMSCIPITPDEYLEGRKISAYHRYNSSYAR